MVLGKNY